MDDLHWAITACVMTGIIASAATVKMITVAVMV